MFPENHLFSDVDHGNACRTGLHRAPPVHEQLGTARIKGSVRFGIGPFNTEAHIQAAIMAVSSIAAMNSKRKAVTAGVVERKELAGRSARQR